MDNVISQGNASYLHHLMRYNKTLQQRNSLLKFFAANQKFDEDSLDIYNQQLAEHGEYIYKQRVDFTEALKPRLQHYYTLISQGREEASIDYQSQKHELSFGEMFAQTLAKDRALQYTSAGLHRDDLIFILEDNSIKHYGSQGQQKSLLIALKLAQYEFIRDHQNLVPVLLLDDIFDKLDERRVATLVKLVHDEDFGQIFITDTHPDRTVELVKQIDANAKIFEI
jgi:DNA replication and repair protein RecF